MARNEALPFPRGKTLFEGSPPRLANGDLDPNAGKDVEGRIYVIDDIDFSGAGVKAMRSNRAVMVMAVRNVSGAAALPKLLSKMKVDGSAYEFLSQIVSQAPTLGDLAFPADEFLPAAGAVDGDIFYIVVGGPAKCITDSAGDTNIPTGAYVVAGGGTAGHVVQQDSNPSAGTATFVQLNGAVGIAVLGVNATSTAILVDVIPRFASY